MLAVQVQPLNCNLLLCPVPSGCPSEHTLNAFLVSYTPLLYIRTLLTLNATATY